MKICIVGTGYVGLVSAACFAEMGHSVIGVDIDAAKVAMLKKGKSPIYEPGLETLLRKGLKSGRLTFTTKLSDALPNIQILFSAVATPPGKGYKADLRAVFSVAEAVAKDINHDLVFVNKSTVPVGTGAECQKRIDAILRKRTSNVRVTVVSNPEFLREGLAVADTLKPDRIIVGMNDGTESPKNRKLMEELYRPLTKSGSPLLFVSRESAEILKYASNAFLATKISFINMLTELCEKTGANIKDIALGMGLDDRIGKKFLNAGIGYGGSCFPKDVKALLATAREYGTPMPIVEATDSVNTRQRHRFILKILRRLPSKAKVAVWGLSFKPETDDMREAPSIDVISELLDAGHSVTTYDPAAMERAQSILPKKTRFVASAMEAVKGAHALILLTEWEEFRNVDLKKIRKAMKGKLLFDGRNIFDAAALKREGLQYFGIGV